MNDTTRRFLLAIIERLPAGDIVELRLFPAIRSGATESGAAVIALEPAIVAPVVEDTPDGMPNDAPPGAGDPRGEDDPADFVEEPPMVQGTLALESPVLASDDAASMESAEPAEDRDVANVTERETPLSITFDDAPHALITAIALDATDNDDDSPYRDDDPPADAEVGFPHQTGAADIVGAGEPNEPDESMALGDILALPPLAGDDPGAAIGDDEDSTTTPEEPASIKRYAILSARYRLTIKGPDRGKWDLELKHEADAPLDTVERVARGVARRAGDESDPEHFSGESLRVALDAPAWATTP